MSAEMEARRTAAAAVLADFRQAVDAYLDEGKPRPDYGVLAGRLAVELGALLDQLDRETPSGLGGFDLTIRQALRDAIRYQQANGGRGWLGQVGLYRSAAREFGIDLGKLPAAVAQHPAAGQLAQIRLVLDTFDWATDDRQFALEQIDEILRGGAR
jgi:hypothetical protein